MKVRIDNLLQSQIEKEVEKWRSNLKVPPNSLVNFPSVRTWRKEVTYSPDNAKVSYGMLQMATASAPHKFNE